MHGGWECRCQCGLWVLGWGICTAQGANDPTAANAAAEADASDALVVGLWAEVRVVRIVMVERADKRSEMLEVVSMFAVWEIRREGMIA